MNTTMHQPQYSPAENASKYRMKPLLWLTCISLSLSVAIMIVIMALGDYGVNSFFIAPIAAGLTIIYHTVILALVKRRAATRMTVIETPTYSPALTRFSVGFAFFLSLMWILATVSTGVVSFLFGSNMEVVTIIPGQILECMEFGIMFAYAVMVSQARRLEPYGQQWYPL